MDDISSTDRFSCIYTFLYMWTSFSLVDGGHQEMYQSKITVTYVETDSKTLLTLIIIAIGIQLRYDHMHQDNLNDWTISYMGHIIRPGFRVWQILLYFCVVKSSRLLVMCSLLRKFNIYDCDSFLLIVSNYRYLFPKIVFLVFFDLFIFNTMNFERLLLEFISCITYYLSFCLWHC